MGLWGDQLLCLFCCRFFSLLSYYDHLRIFVYTPSVTARSFHSSWLWGFWGASGLSTVLFSPELIFVLLRFSRNKKHHPDPVNKNSPAVTNIVTMFSLIAQTYKQLPAAFVSNWLGLIPSFMVVGVWANRTSCLAASCPEGIL